MNKEYIKYIIRNITRKKKQSIFTILCIAISSTIILSNISMNNGLQSKLKEGINQAISGQLTIYSAKDSKINILESQMKEQNPFTLSDQVLNNIRNKESLVLNKRIRLGSLVSYFDETSYVNIHALEDDHFKRIKSLLRLKEGTMPNNGKSILISETTSDEIKCNVGDSILLLANNINDYMSDEIAIVSGIFEENGIAIFLNYNAFIPYTFGKELVQLEDETYLELIVNSTDNKDIPIETIKKVKKEVNDVSSEIHAVSWEQTIPLFYKIVQVWKGGGYFTQVIFIVFSLLILINLTTLIINSRKKEFGTLLAFGFTWVQIGLMIAAEYVLITVISVLVGYSFIEFLIGSIADSGIYIGSKDMQSALMTEYLKPIIYIKDIIYILVLFVMTTLFAVFISIIRIHKVNPILLINKR
ncbi:ABC-type lipoprotein release transport system permease subunit [Dysgonomonas sp. PFB1-18]|uniref:ABC transporter permease n=1 Tax=unclassified Dysgonomonas TaxID=2630389 RepID=UPI0024752707|nr:MULTISPECIES: ABC transporter permease [unclassified Dysgonomonas]MDH6309367.1 ABC-type lipoprotein release transport system permease subunit [Dysgonomonas sp. PF1-14]MDH6339768.1 ABC-type lipoprotein release transport system permease subunit [Dysgonomonas sp. PF1-16]MDH6381416.1 ABC-type lipoprotein release transport system permease subunit [Dysgonomonas sp. PFB1-18]MDH6398631.1 ABC-type lipoprotein release transport system permease subunit [Dysgonomonas sp. PF1-23]